MLSERIRDQGERVGDEKSAGRALDQAEHDQDLNARGACAEQRRRPKARNARSEYPPPAKQVAQRPADQDERAET
jgi:hypothetical protein